MSFKSQENNMRRLADLLSRDLSYIFGDRETGPNGDKRVFLNTGKTFLRTLGKDLGLRDVKVIANPGGIAVSGDCTLYGMWEDSGIFIQISQPCYQRQNVLLFRSIRSLKDHKGGYNRYISLNELAVRSYPWLLAELNDLRKDVAYERAA